jgi:hypothetical protein
MMFIAIGLIGALWIVGEFIVPDKNGPPSAAKTAAVAVQPDPAPADRPAAR